MLDLDGFKAVNDTFGHETGDVALQLVGQRFQGSVRDGDTLARIGGDEFAVLLPQLTDQQAAALVAQRLIGALATPFDFGTHTVGVGTSIGIAAWPTTRESGDALVAAADTAMYRAKRAGTNQFRWATQRFGEDIPSLTAAGLGRGTCDRHSGNRRSAQASGRADRSIVRITEWTPRTAMPSWPD